MRPGGENSGGGEQARVDVGHWIAILHRRCAAFACDRHQPGEALCDEVESTLLGQWAVAAEAGHRAVDQRFILCRQNGVGEAEFFHRAATIILDQHIRVADHAQQDFASARLLEIKCQAALAPVEHHEWR